jgi:hypothetical protein
MTSIKTKWYLSFGWRLTSPNSRLITIGSITTALKMLELIISIMSNPQAVMESYS